MSQIIRRVQPISQARNSMKCWAAVTAMILGRTGDRIVDTIVAEARAAGVPIRSDDSLSPSAVGDLATAFHLTCDTVSGVLSGQDVADRMGVACVGLMGQETAGKHAVICHGMIGDFSASSTCDIWGVDPRGFTAINMGFWDFQNQFAIEFILHR